MYFHYNAPAPPPEDPPVLFSGYYNFGSGNATQPVGYSDADVIYNVVDGYGWTNGGSGTPPQCFTRASSTVKTETCCRVDAYYNSQTSSWVDTGIAIIRYRVDVPNGTYNVKVGCGDPASFGQNHKAFVEVSADGGSTWVSVFDSVTQSASIETTVVVNVTAGYLHFRFGEESDTPTADRTALAYIDVEQV